MAWYGTKEDNINKLQETMRACDGDPSIEQAELIESYAHNIAILIRAEKSIK